MFGLFDSKSEKLVKKAYKISREYTACHMRVLKNPNSDFWIKYFYETELHLEEIFKESTPRRINSYLLKSALLQEKKLGYFVDDGKYWKHLEKFDQGKIDILDGIWNRVIEQD